MNTAEIIATVAAGFTGLGLILSGWAAVTAHKARTWQQRRDEERRQTRVTVKVHGILIYVDGRPEASVVALVFNEGERTEYLQDIHLRSAHPTNPTGAMHIQPIGPLSPNETGWPREIPPRASAIFDHDFQGASADDLEWLRCGLIAVAVLGSGVKVRSDVHYIEWRDPPGP